MDIFFFLVLFDKRHSNCIVTIKIIENILFSLHKKTPVYTVSNMENIVLLFKSSEAKLMN